jgi:Raf kinase inhibitor-like YbhB/YbcL family protein
MKKSLIYFLVAVCIVCYLIFTQMKTNKEGVSMKIMSSMFNDTSQLPKKYTCDGDDINPPLEWQNVPQDTKSLALIVDDPDAPNGTWVHWIVFNIPPTTNKLDENMSIATLSGARQGINSSNKIKFQGACPPQGHGVHRYYFTLYALDTVIDLQEGVSKQALQEAMKDHILSQAQIMATYERK